LERAPDAPWNTRLTSPRRLAWQDVPLQEARVICTALGGKVNDLVLAVLAGALRRYFELHGWDTEDVTLRVAVPVNARRDPDDRALGNHVSVMLAGLPLGLADPRERFEAVSRQMNSLKETDQAGGFENLLRLLGRIPEPVQAALGGRLAGPNLFTNLICTNVRGPETPLYCLGHPMIAHYPWVLATWRMGLSVAVMSYLHSIYFSFTGDAGVLPDLDRMAGFLREDFWQLHDDVTRVRRRPSPPAAAKRSRASGAKRTSGRAPPTVSRTDGSAPDRAAVRRPKGVAGRSPGTNGRSPEPRVPTPTGSARRRAVAARRGKEAS
jgi:WS/DGAT/MGAT family acyltransferase